METLLAALTQWLIERRKPIAPLYHDPSGLVGAAQGIESRTGVPKVGSAESTVIRARAATTTVDHVDATVIRAAAPGKSS